MTAESQQPDSADASANQEAINKASGVEEKKRNVRAVFGSGLGKFALIAAGGAVVIFLLIAVRSFNSVESTAPVKAPEVSSPPVDARDGNVGAVTEDEAAKRAERAAQEADEALAGGKSYQAPLDVNIVEAKAGEGAVSDARFNANMPAPPTPATAAPQGSTPSDTDRQAAQQRQQQLQQDLQRQEGELRSANEAREKYIEDVKGQALKQVEGMFGASANTSLGRYSAIKYPAVSAKNSSEEGLSSANQTQNGTNKTQVGLKLLFKAGSSIYADLDSEINTDDGSDVFATVRGGEWNGAKLLGSVEKTQNNIRARFSLLAPQDGRPSVPINAIALRSEDAKQGIAKEIDHHTLSRYSSLGFASLLSGYGKAFETTPGTTVVNPGGTTVQTTDEPSSRQIIGRSVGEIGTTLSSEIKRGFSRQPTYSTPAGTGFAVFFLADAQAPSGQ